MSRKRMSPWATLAGKINLLVVASLLVGLGAAAVTFALLIVGARQQVTRRSLEEQANFLYASIENFMMPGEAPIAVSFFDDVRLLSPEYRVDLYRRDGQRAFSDGTTIDSVNRRLSQNRFEPRRAASDIVIPPDQPEFDQAIALPPSDVFFSEREGSRSFFRIYRPLINLPKCTRCHGADHTIRGVIDLRTDVTAFERTQAFYVAGTGLGFAVLVGFLALVIARFMRRVVVEPVQEIGGLCRRVTDGSFDGQVEPRSEDEIGSLARTVNGMVKGLRERSQLAKFVSAGTLGSLDSEREAERVDRTLLFTDVRGFTAYTERTPPERVVETLNRLLERQSELVHAYGGDVDKFVGDEVVSVFSGADAPSRALRAAAAIQRELASAQAADGDAYDGLELGAGVASGHVIHGMIGSERRADFTVIGDSVNVASRLCALAKPGEILVCSVTKAAAPRLPYTGPFKTKLKGKEAWQIIFYLDWRAVESDS